MKLTWVQGSNVLDVDGIKIPCSCNVRNEINGNRRKNEIVYSIPEHKPYQPRIFPIGVWTVMSPLKRESDELAPYFIPTNANQELPVWEVVDGRYDKKTDKKTRDSGYGIHYSKYANTLGCIKITNKKDLLELVEKIRNSSGAVILEVKP